MPDHSSDHLHHWYWLRPNDPANRKPDDPVLFECGCGDLRVGTSDARAVADALEWIRNV